MLIGRWGLSMEKASRHFPAAISETSLWCLQHAILVDTEISSFGSFLRRVTQRSNLAIGNTNIRACFSHSMKSTWALQTWIWPNEVLSEDVRCWRLFQHQGEAPAGSGDQARAEREASWFYRLLAATLGPRNSPPWSTGAVHPNGHFPPPHRCVTTHKHSLPEAPSSPPRPWY